MSVSAAPRAAAEPASLELPIKATFLEKFGDFITWPAASFEQNGDLFNICIYGEDPFGPTIDRVAADNRTAGHAIVVRRIQSMAEANNCNILYFGKIDQQTVTNFLHALRGKPVLTVTDERNGDTPRGIIHFTVIENHVRFSIDEERAVENGLTISSKLLGVAMSVNARRREGTR